MGKKKQFPSSSSGRMAERDQRRRPIPGSPAEQEKSAAEYYQLNTKAIDELVTASEDNSPPVSAAELRKYRSGPRITLADWVKALLLKIWTGGMICYFFIWGLSTFTLNQWDHLVILGVALGLVTNLITNNILRFISGTPGAYDRWMMFPQKSFLYLPLDLIYGLLLVFCVVMSYNGINLLVAGNAPDAAAVLTVEPILFGIFVTLWDLCFIKLKQLFIKVLRDAEKTAGHTKA